MGSRHADDPVPKLLDDASQIMRDERLVLNDQDIGGDLFGDFRIRGVDQSRRRMGVDAEVIVPADRRRNRTSASASSRCRRSEKRETRSSV